MDERPNSCKIIRGFKNIRMRWKVALFPIICGLKHIVSVSYTKCDLKAFLVLRFKPDSGSKKSRLSLLILDNRKCCSNHLKGDNVKIWVEVIIVTFLYAVAIVDVLMVNSNDVNLAKTRYVHFA